MRRCLQLSSVALFSSLAVAYAAPTVSERYGNLPMAFEANAGQADKSVKFLAHGDGYGVYLNSQEAVLTLRQFSSLHMRLHGAASSVSASGEELLPGKVNYFIGNDPAGWHGDISTFAKARFRDIYPGIDVLYYGKQRKLEFDFVVSPGADPRSIRLDFGAATRIRLTAAGDLAVVLPEGEVLFHKPVVYQKARSVPGRFRIDSGHVVRFALGAYNHSEPLVIDPVLSYATYLGGTSDSGASAIAVDQFGSAYVGGFSGPGFPTTSGAFQSAPKAFENPFIAKINPAGTALVYATYLGGSGSDGLSGIAVDSGGDAYVTGGTNSLDFPITPGAFQTALEGNDGDDPISSAFVTKLDATGSRLLYSTYLGGSGSGYPDFQGDSATAIVVDGQGNAYVTGNAGSRDFPVTKGAFESTPPAKADPSNSLAFVSKINSTGSALVYSTYLGGEAFDQPFSIALGPGSTAYVAGSTSSAKFPVTAGAFETHCPNMNSCGFVAKLNAAGSGLVYATYLGGNGSDNTLALAVDSGGSAYVSGNTYSPDFPVTPGAFQTSPPRDVYLSKLNTAGTALVYSTFLEGSKGSNGQLSGQPLQIVVDAGGEAYVLGSTSATDFPVTPDALTPAANGGNFLTKVNAAGSGLIYSSYATGAAFDALAIDAFGSAYLAGTATGDSLTATPNALQKTNRSSSGQMQNAVVEKIEFGQEENIDVLSQPAGESFTLSGQGCPTGVLKTPYTGVWSGPCTLTWVSPDLSSAHTRRTFVEWADGDTSASRLLVPRVGIAEDPYVAEFLTEYQLTTSVNSAAGGQITPSPSAGNWFPAGTTAVVSALPNPGYVFAGFTGALSGETTPQNVLMNAPQSVEAIFLPTPVSAGTAIVSSKSGTPGARNWVIVVTNNGPGIAYDAQLVGLMFTQSFGPACSKLPFRTTRNFPLALGSLKAGTSVSVPVMLDFSGCPANARFTVTIDEVANGGASVDVVQLQNQFE